jgi:carbohydrate-binding DOMON domain-containing protein
MKSLWAAHGFEALIVALFAFIALTANTFLAPPVMPADRMQQIPITMTTITGTMSTTGTVSSTQTMTSTIVVPVPVAGFPVESIFLGLLLGIGALIIIRTRRRRD